MRTIETTGTITADGVLTVHVPNDVAPGQHPVVIIIDEQTHAPEARAARDWPVGFFETTYGSLADDPIVRGKQGSYEVREAIE